MNSILKPFVHISILLSSLVFQMALAEESYNSYDSIIKDLSTTHTEMPSVRNKPDQFNLIQFHLGVGLISSQLAIDLAGSQLKGVTLNGYEARFGIDLFSRNWEAIGAVRSFTPETTRQTEVSMREFDLLLGYKNLVYKKTGEFSVGGGMAARYLDLSGIIPAGANRSYTTPSTVFYTGFGLFFTPNISTHLFVSYRNPLISETIDSGSLDGSMSMVGHF